MSDYVRVRDQKTGHEYTTRARLVVEGLEVIEKNPLGRDGLPKPPLYRVPLGAQPARSAQDGKPKRPRKPVTPEPTAIGGPDNQDGRTAESEQENH